MRSWDEQSLRNTQEFVAKMQAHAIGTVALYGERSEFETKTVGFFRPRQERTGKMLRHYDYMDDGWVIDCSTGDGPDYKFVTQQSLVYPSTKAYETSIHADIRRTPYATTSARTPEAHPFAFGTELAQTAIKLLGLDK